LGLEEIALQMLAIGLLILAAHFGGVVANRLGVGEVVGQMLGGVIVGPHFLKVLQSALSASTLPQTRVVGSLMRVLDKHLETYADSFNDLRFFVFVFLGLIAFSIGEELHRDRVRATGPSGFTICLIQGALTWFLLTAGFLTIGFRPAYALIIGSIGIATAPALTFALMNRLRIEGRLRTILANIVVLADFIEVIVFSISLAFAVMLENQTEASLFGACGYALRDFAVAGLFGMLLFWILKILIPRRIRTVSTEAESEGTGFLTKIVMEHPTPSVEIMLVIVGVLSVGLSVVIYMGLPFLVTAVIAGFLISNFHSHALFDSLRLENITPILNLFFFALVGASVELESFTYESLFLIGMYLCLRGIGKVLGTWLGCKLTRQDPKVTACLPNLILPQAGIAAVETLIVAQTLDEGVKILQIVIPALVIFELGGAWLSERTLLRWKLWTVGEGAAMEMVSSEVAPGDYSVSNLVGNRIIYDLQARDRKGAIRAICEYLQGLGVISEADSIATACMEREKLSSTALGGGIALPHCRTAEVDNIVAACAVTQPDSGIAWDAPDGKPVRLIFLLICPETKPEQQLHALRSIAGTIKQPRFAQQLSEATKQRRLEELFAELSLAREK